jgi:hypothetical protein
MMNQMCDMNTQGFHRVPNKYTDLQWVRHEYIGFAPCADYVAFFTGFAPCAVYVAFFTGFAPCAVYVALSGLGHGGVTD